MNFTTGEPIVLPQWIVWIIVAGAILAAFVALGQNVMKITSPYKKLLARVGEVENVSKEIPVMRQMVEANTELLASHQKLLESHDRLFERHAQLFEKDLTRFVAMDEKFAELIRTSTACDRMVIDGLYLVLEILTETDESKRAENFLTDMRRFVMYGEAMPRSGVAYTKPNTEKG